MDCHAYVPVITSTLFSVVALLNAIEHYPDHPPVSRLREYVREASVHAGNLEILAARLALERALPLLQPFGTYDYGDGVSRAISKQIVTLTRMIYQNGFDRMRRECRSYSASESESSDGEPEVWTAADEAAQPYYDSDGNAHY